MRRRIAVALIALNVHEGHISPVVMAKVLPRINAITFQGSKRADGPSFLLWCNGRPEASIGSSQE